MFSYRYFGINFIIWIIIWNSGIFEYTTANPVPSCNNCNNPCTTNPTTTSAPCDQQCTSSSCNCNNKSTSSCCNSCNSCTSTSTCSCCNRSSCSCCNDCSSSCTCTSTCSCCSKSTCCCCDKPDSTATTTTSTPIVTSTPTVATTTTTPRSISPTTNKIFTCPNYTFWNGVSCQNTINIHNEINNPTNVVSNNENKLIIYFNESKSEIISSNTSTHYPTTTPSTPDYPPLCCTIFGPRKCVLRGRWICKNSRFRLCERFCTDPEIRLIPSQTIYVNQILVTTPYTVGHCKNEYCSEDIYEIDCSGCIDGGICSRHCYDYGCNGQDCVFHSQVEFCIRFKSHPLCKRNSTCFEDVCL